MVDRACVFLLHTPETTLVPYFREKNSKKNCKNKETKKTADKRNQHFERRKADGKVIIKVMELKAACQ